MKKKLAVYAILSVFLLVFGFCLAFDHIAALVHRDPYAHERENLAKELEVDINLYSKRGFPQNYFYEALKPGMSSEEVHQIVRGYDTVYLCDARAEFYYFFNTDGDKAVRFLIRYDEMGNLKYTRSEDENSRSLHLLVHDCIPGLKAE